MTPRRLARALLTAAALVATTAGAASAASAAPGAHPGQPSRIGSVLPAPVFAQARPGDDFRLTPFTTIRTVGSPDAAPVANYLAGLLRPATGYLLPVTRWPLPQAITLQLGGADPAVGAGGYTLDVRRGGVLIRANSGDGLFDGVQTLRQLLPPAIESDRAVRGAAWTVSGGSVRDTPRFEHRGAMLDVARHFLGVADVKRYIDEIALLKINYLHLHLADDQGWRIEIKSWPNLTVHGGSTEVGGGPGGYYTQEQYRNLVGYAASRHITLVPEIDMPGHTNAALSSYAELNCDGVAPPLYTGTSVGFSSLCVGKDLTYRFLDDVIRELAALTPGPYLHIGGDEAHATTPADYQAFMARALPIVGKYGKKIVGWHEIAKTTPPTTALPQYWGSNGNDAAVVAAAGRGNKIIMSPSNKAYLDMKYNKNTPLGQHWAGYIEVRDAYDWDPGNFLPGLPESAVQGVEAPIWTETLTTIADVEYMAFPRLPAIAELGWSPQATHDFTGFAQRVAAQAPRWDELGINYYRSPQIPW